MILAVHSYPGGNEALKRHWRFFENAGADRIIVIGTDTGDTWHPEGIECIKIGANKYMDGSHLPMRLLKTFQELHSLSRDDVFCVVEYDTLIFHPLRHEAMEHAVASNLAGYRQKYNFYHNPWMMHRDVVPAFIEEGMELIESGVCSYGSWESSPDVFFGFVCYIIGQAIQADLWKEFSRNSYDRPGDLELARLAYRSGVDVIHGIKTERELEFLLN